MMNFKSDELARTVLVTKVVGDKEIYCGIGIITHLSVGSNAWVWAYSENGQDTKDVLITSEVQEITEDDKDMVEFRTKNSTYRLRSNELGWNSGSKLNSKD